MPRRVYLDLGANWADTIDSYSRLGGTRAHREATNWEVYAFEASPFLMPFLDSVATWRNAAHAEEEPPQPCVPPVGSTSDLMSFAGDVLDPTRPSGDPLRSCRRPYAKSAFSCMMSAFAKAYRWLVSGRSAHLAAILLHPDTLRARLDEASTPHDSLAARPRFTFVPAAVGGRQGGLNASSIGTFGIEVWMRELRRAGLASTLPAVPVIDVAGWLASHFDEGDYIVAKVDVEGAESPLFDSLARRHALGLIDVLAYECHASNTACGAQLQSLRSRGVNVVHLCWLHASVNASSGEVGPCSRHDDAAFWRKRREAWRRGFHERCGRFNVSLVQPKEDHVTRI
jgi:hypothetical protein